MPNPGLSPEKIAKVKDLLSQGITRDEVSNITGVSQGSVSRIKAKMGHTSYREAAPEIKQTEEFSGDNWNISIPNTRICTLDELVKHCKIDLQIWEVERFICNKWEVGAKVGEKLVAEPLFQVKAYLKRKKAVAHARAEIEMLRKEAIKYSPKFTGFTPRKPAGTGIAVELSVFDHHFGALIWGEETGGQDWDNRIALNTWKDAFSSLIHRTNGYKPEMAVIPLGNDQQNADNRAGTTENLTPQNMDSRYQKVYGISKEASKWAIDSALAEYGRVHVPIVPGNHDPLASWHLGDYLATWYRNCPGVTIDNRVQHRKWWEHGIVMVMWEHGHKGKLPDYDRIMASENPEMWGRTRCREAHTGHIHHKQVIEQKGATIRSLSSLRPSCAWAAENHHTGSIRAAEAFVWSKAEGLVGQATYSILQASKAA
jgi:hypothetical protein